jgi:hypothetical protein
MPEPRRNRRRNLTPSSVELPVESLEPRQLLAGDVFQTPQVLSPGLPTGNVLATATAHLGSDTNVDLLVLQTNGNNLTGGTVGILRGNGDGTFAAPQLLTIPGVPLSMAVGDVNGDGIPDVAVSETLYSGSVPGAILIFLGNANGTFAAAETIDADASDTGLQIADVNGDHRADLVYSDAGAIGVRLQNADGTFAAPVTSDANGSVNAIAVGDVTGDGVPDLVTSSISQADENISFVSVLKGNGDGSFQAPVNYSVDEAGADEVQLVDLNGDSHLDIVDVNDGHSTSNGVNGDVDVFMNNGDGTFANAVGYGTSTNDVDVIDVNGDGKLDLVTSYGGVLSTYLGNGDGTFSTTADTADFSASAAGLVVADVNKDGHADALLFASDGSSITEFLNTGALAVKPTVTVNPSPSTAAANAPILFTATVAAPSSTDPTPTGSIEFLDADETVLATETLAAGPGGTASASFTTSFTGAGALNLINVQYAGDFNYLAAAGSAYVTITTKGSGGSGGSGGAAVITPTFGSKLVLPTATVVAGQKLSDTVPVVITNTGGAVRGTFTVDLYADRTDTLDGNQTLVYSATERNVSLKTDGHTQVNINSKPLPASLPAGTYFLIAQVTDPAGQTASVATTRTLSVASPVVTLSASVVPGKPLSLKLNQAGTLKVAITNTGNIESSGPLVLSLSPSADGTSPVPGTILATTSVKNAAIKPGKTTTYTIHLKHLAGMTAGTFFPYVAVSLDTSITATAIGTVSFTLL